MNPLARSIKKPTVSFDSTNAALLEHTAATHGETAEQYFMGATHLVGIWGEIIELYGLTPGILHGLGDLAAATVVIFDIAEHVDENSKNIAEKRALREATGLDNPATPDTMLLEIDEGCWPNIALASLYFDRAPIGLIAAGLDIRDAVLKAQDEGKTYVVSPDNGVTWTDIQLFRFSDVSD